MKNNTSLYIIGAFLALMASLYTFIMYRISDPLVLKRVQEQSTFFEKGVEELSDTLSRSAYIIAFSENLEKVVKEDEKDKVYVDSDFIKKKYDSNPKMVDELLNDYTEVAKLKEAIIEKYNNKKDFDPKSEEGKKKIREEYIKDIKNFFKKKYKGSLIEKMVDQLEVYLEMEN